MNGGTIVAGMISALVVAVLSEEYKRWRDKGGSLANPVVGILVLVAVGFFVGWLLADAGVALLPTVILCGFLGWLIQRGLARKRASSGSRASRDV